MQNLLASAPADTAAAGEAMQPQLQKHPEVVDDFVRNFLVRTGLSRTLEAFETEWCAQLGARRCRLPRRPSLCF